MNQRGIQVNHKRSLLVFIMAFSLFLTGCWDSSELQKLDIIATIGIDKGSDNKNNRFRTTVQIVNPSQVSGGQQGGKFQSSPVTTYTAEGGTILEALRKITSQGSGELFFPHVQLLVIGEKLAKQGIKDLFDLIERDSQFRVIFPVIIARGTSAEKVLKVLTPSEAIPSLKILGSLESSKEGWGEYSSTRADQVIDGLSGGSLWITGIQLNGDPKKGNGQKNMQVSPAVKTEIRGLGVFKNGKLIEWLDEDAARGVTWTNNEVSRTVMNLGCQRKQNRIGVSVSRSKSTIKIQIKNQKPIIHISVRTEGDISEVECPINLSSHKEIEMLQKEMEKEIKDEVVKAVTVAQKQRSDIFKFGEYINIEDKSFWKKIKNRWEDEIFPETELDVNIKAFIRHTGMRTKPYFK